MKRLFGRTPAEYAASCSRALDCILDEKSEEEKVKKAYSKLERLLKEMAVMLYGDGEKPVDTNKVNRLIRELRSSDLMARLVMKVERLGFEIPKSISKILSFWLHDKGLYNDAIAYFDRHRGLVGHLVSHFEREEVSLPCAEIVKEALVHPKLLKSALEEDKGNIVFKVLEYVGVKDIAFASEAYGMLDTIINCRLSRDQNISADMQKEHLKLVATWLDANYEEFWKKIHTFMEPTGSHLMMEQMLKLVYQVLKTHRNYYIMMRYINDPENLTRVMRLLRVQNKKIQVMAFNVFKIFVANPEKSEKIIEILLPNVEKIMKFFQALGADDELDGKFEDDLEVLNEQLKELKIIAEQKTTTTSTSTNANASANQGQATQEENKTSAPAAATAAAAAAAPQQQQISEKKSTSEPKPDSNETE
mmetsp:Transcript_6301/g.11619  ORF Transcript_6301/g.11619 Transcript_6301/m.11619 type:complete len:419 (+) Transcript_6301:126-1382(+)|eukprot:CAMPEP_0197540890 /NCGR_PEP_ID=MMETSP1318-20131121/66849_1 /TAXON_ID=552666 /ORGANISM="Partenskyella glossopodia, Strain RCC365" /LENGTH=418 /DNA_ID=CAMNT_0043100003 /DNA_START=111 /DNA_END=1367 /DNA_ORIENTATION=-